MIAMVLLSAATAGCNSSGDGAGKDATTVVYVCTETGETFVAAVQPTPAIHPQTGERTLMLGMYCDQCQKWHAAPPMEILQRSESAAICPLDGTPLRFDGPKPE